MVYLLLESIQMKHSRQAWEAEYSTKRLMTGEKPPKSLLNWLKHVVLTKGLRGQSEKLGGMTVLDLGSGEGKNALHVALMGATVHCIELASNAVQTTIKRAKEERLSDRVLVTYGSIGAPYQFPNETFDLIMDVTSSNSLSESERSTYLAESARVLKSDGMMFVRALCRDGDANAKKLLQLHPGSEHDTYIQPDWGLVERVFSEADLRALYGKYFIIQKLSKETHYTTLGARKYKRNFWILHLVKEKQ